MCNKQANTQPFTRILDKVSHLSECDRDVGEGGAELTEHVIVDVEPGNVGTAGSAAEGAGAGGLGLGAAADDHHDDLAHIARDLCGGWA